LWLRALSAIFARVIHRLNVKGISVIFIGADKLSQTPGCADQ
jgi:hypothetical protein